MCHTRLSIIDLSHSGHQPFVSDDGRWHLLYNGEIYNYLELRHELKSLGCHFTTDSDTEVLLWAWRTWGQAGLPKLRGMFAFVVVDVERSTFTAIRDPFGIKPLYFAQGEYGWGFASEIPALRKLVRHTGMTNHKVAYEYLAFGGYDRSDQTFFSGICSVCPGQLVEIDLSRKEMPIVKSTWFTRPESIEAPISWEAAVVQVKHALQRSVEIHLRADVGLGVALSGGVDSSALTALVRNLEPHSDIKSFSFVSPGHLSDESFWSNRVSQHLGTSQHIVSPSASTVAADIDDVVAGQGEPFGSLSIYAQYAVYREARSAGLKVMLDGQGGDEVFGGYGGYPEFRLRSLLAQGDAVGAIQFLSGWRLFPKQDIFVALSRLAGTFLPSNFRSAGARVLGRSPTPRWILPSELREVGVMPIPPSLYGYPLREKAGGRELAKRLSSALFSGEMVNLLRHGDRNSMRWSIESRVPFLNVDVVTLAQSLPEEFLVSSGGLTKNILRHALRGLLPDDVIFRRDKIGFEAPDLQWLRGMSDNPAKLIEGLALIPWVDHSAARELLNEVWDGAKPYTQAVWRLINLAKWSQQATQYP